MSRTHSAHIKSDANAFGGLVNSAHIVPMTNVKLKEIRDAKNIHKYAAKRTGDPVARKFRIIRAKQIETAQNEHTQSVNSGPDMFFVLVDSERNKLKQTCISFEEARRRNDDIRELGMQWVRGEL